jgi:hypothetical protein
MSLILEESSCRSAEVEALDIGANGPVPQVHVPWSAAGVVGLENRCSTRPKRQVILARINLNAGIRPGTDENEVVVSRSVHGLLNIGEGRRRTLRPIVIYSKRCGLGPSTGEKQASEHTDHHERMAHAATVPPV